MLLGFFSPLRTKRGVGGSLLPAFLLNVASFEASISEIRQMVYPLKYQLIQSSSRKRETALSQWLYYAMSFHLIGMTTDNQKMKSWFLLPQLSKKKKKKKKAQASQHALWKKSLVIMNPHCTVTERMKAVIIFKSSGTMQVPAFQSKGRQNDQSYVKNGFKETRPCFIRKTTGSVDQQYHIFD